MLGRQIRAKVGLRCDFCHHTVPPTKIAYQVSEGKAQGIFHGPRCWQAAVKHREELEKKITE